MKWVYKIVFLLFFCIGSGSLHAQSGVEILESAEKGDVNAQYKLGYNYSLVGKWDQAIYWLQKAAEKGNAKAYDELAVIYYVLANMYAAGKNGVARDFNKAHEFVDRAISIRPDLPVFLDSKGEIFLKENKKEEAKEIWKQFKEKFPESVRDSNTVFFATMLKMESRKQNEIDINVPISSVSSTKTFAFIIANESYKRVSPVQYATDDGVVFAEYCKKTLGIPEKNIKVWTDATLGDMTFAVNKIKQIADAYDGDANIILYYAGHGIPSDDQQNSYLLPIDGYSADASSLSLQDLYGTLGKLNVKSVLVIIDACFSGSQRNGEMFASTRGVAIKAKQETIEGNLIVLSAAQGDETALPYDEKNHGLFTYFLLKKLQESKGDCTIGELSDYVITNVKRTSITIGDKIQTPKIVVSQKMRDWENKKLR